ncbi:glutamate racemase [Tenacibaculum finnmarkense]|uniref:glutamate racemase n=1 Tax=Tenacibaculum finnmarkense TaxID=2781243 RepID=UPI001E60892E|nr:glutamate racemase [Tenacibaculum finnmarkense]MCD8400442.1 glutamate racemase [Tenacibaculum finnmarkense genomovar ulcerans]MCG8236610.1 glutamate racemase [Tenacibaculum finnmarkense genomovar ulcerans]MCG8238826.1 glutamate racemase [Tenacibaculum finnmarkense genomovar ulcerans]MCG8749856.1 glutamate racemase [Tenacibaculum finnmarkense]MCG8755081.1 glutamate racemase [Tenacibaculum finnmarkense]
MTTQQPIGIFDSGIGGTSIWKEIHTLLANENTIYLSDSKNAPYGQKSTEEILALSIKNTEFLISKGCKIIVVACNTATTNAIEYLRRNYPIPIIGIEPAIKTASIQTKTGTIGILATQGTLNSRLFEKTAASINSDIVIMEQVGNGLVELIENGKMYSAEMTKLLKKHLSLMLSSKCDCIVLGCTHYPYLIPQIKKIVGNTVHIIDSGEAVAKQTKKILAENNLINTSKINTYNTFYVNKDKSVLDIILKDYKNVTVNFLEF